MALVTHLSSEPQERKRVSGSKARTPHEVARGPPTADNWNTWYGLRIICEVEYLLGHAMAKTLCPFKRMTRACLRHRPDLRGQDGERGRAGDIRSLMMDYRADLQILHHYLLFPVRVLPNMFDVVEEEDTMLMHIDDGNNTIRDPCILDWTGRSLHLDVGLA